MLFRSPGRSVIVKKAKVLPIEAIVRGYITGGGLKEYNKKGSISGIQLEKGLVESQKLREPIFTPSTKAPMGEHDENIPFEEAVKLLGADLAEKVRDISLKLYTFATEHAEKAGIILADTKFADVSANNATVGNLSAYELPQGFELNGRIKGFQLAYGAVIAYKELDEYRFDNSIIGIDGLELVSMSGDGLNPVAIVTIAQQ